MDSSIFALTKQAVVFNIILNKLEPKSVYNLAISCKRFFNIILNSTSQEGNRIKEFLWKNLCEKNLKQLKADQDVLKHLNPKLIIFKVNLSGNEMLEIIKFKKEWENYTNRIAEKSKNKSKSIPTIILNKFKKLASVTYKNNSSETTKTNDSHSKISNPLEKWIKKDKLKTLEKDLNSNCKKIEIENTDKFISFCKKHPIPRNWIKTYNPNEFMSYSNFDPVIQNYLVGKNISDHLLTHACKEINLSWVQSLISQGVDVNEKSSEEGFNEAVIIKTPLYLAIENNCEEIVDELLKDETIDVNMRAGQDEEINPLCLAIVLNKYPMIKSLVNHKNIEINPLRNRNAPLIFSCTYGNLETVKILLESKKANVNIQDDKGYTPLMYASCRNYQDIVELLLEHGADISLKNDEGETALSIAQKSKNDRIVEILKNLEKSN